MHVLLLTPPQETQVQFAAFKNLMTENKKKAYLQLVFAVLK